MDNALLRPGRFDRRVTVGLPDVKGREQILNVHVKNKKLAEEARAGVNFSKIAERLSRLHRKECRAPPTEMIRTLYFRFSNRGQVHGQLVHMFPTVTYQIEGNMRES